MFSILRRRTLIYASSSLLRIGIMIVTLPLMTLRLDPVDYGLFAVAVAIATVFAILPQLGSSVALANGFHDASPQDRREFLSSMLFLSSVAGIGASAVFVLLWNSLAHYFVDREAELSLLALACVGASIVSSGWAAITAEVLTLDGRAGRFAVVSVLRDLVGAAVALIALYGFDAGILALFFGHAAAAVADLVCSATVLRQFFVARLSMGHIRAILFDLQITTTQFLDVGGRALERVIISKKLGLDIVGIVSHSQSYETIVMAFVKSITRSIWPDNLSEARSPGSAFPIARAATGVIAMICLFASIALGTIGFDVIGVLTHGKFNVAAYFAAAWVANLAISTTGFAPKAAAYAHGRSGLISMSMVFSRLISLCALILMIGWAEETAIVVAALLAAIAVKVVMYFGIARVQSVPFQDFRVVLVVITAYFALISSFYLGDDLNSRALLLLIWTLAATILNIGVIRSVGKRLALSR